MMRFRSQSRPAGVGETRCTRRLFLALLGLCYLLAFASLGVQVAALYGPDGLLPIADVLDSTRTTLAWWRMPTLLRWTGAEAATLESLAGVGVCAGVALVFGVAPRAASFVAWFAYLSFVTPSRVFLNFQWDILLLEAGFLAFLWAPGGWRPRVAAGAPVWKPGLWLLRFLVFRLMFASGVVKLASGDDSWWQLTALAHHFETQPLPTWTAWYAHQLPVRVGQAATAAMFFIELAVPFAIFAPRRWRMLAFWPLALLQVAIAATGNYGFFNLLTLVLCVTLLDDRALAMPLRLFEREPASFPDAQPPTRRAQRGHATVARVAGVAATTGALVLALAGAAHMTLRLAGPGALPAPAMALVRWTAPWHFAASYGLFADMTERRPEIVLEGSRDGHEWVPYRFRWKPGDPLARPRFVAPHQPRLDWQMWFAALSGPSRAAWLVAVQRRLLMGDPAVLSLLAADPFPDRPPRYVRALLYDYRFTTVEERRADGRWWERRLLGLWSSVQHR